MMIRPDDPPATARWQRLFRAGIASCLATCIAMRAAQAGIELSALEVRASSRSDLRGLFGMKEATGEVVAAGPRGVQLVVRIAATSPAMLGWPECCSLDYRRSCG